MSAAPRLTPPRRAVGIAEGLEAALYWHRGKAILLLFGLFAGLIGWWIVSNLAAFATGRAGWWVLPTSTAADIGLTLGTLALATAAFIQARANAGQREDAFHQIQAADRLALAAQRQADAIREQTIALSTAHLHLETLTRAPSSGAGGQGPTRTREVRVHNAGPGVARGLQWRRVLLDPPPAGIMEDPPWRHLVPEVLGVGQFASLPLQEEDPAADARRAEVQVRVGKGPGGPAGEESPAFARLPLELLNPTRA